MRIESQQQQLNQQIYEYQAKTQSLEYELENSREKYVVC